jgi:UDP-3-O-[3-hydroxymyristoyl] glucosamine N-acyltransferase
MKTASNKHMEIGNDCEIHPTAIIYPNVRIGDRVKIGPYCVIGNHGFEVKKIYGKNQVVSHLGGVHIDDDVEMLSHVTIDRRLDEGFTYIGKEVKIANQVQISHGARIGYRSILAAKALVANSEIGERVLVGRGVVIHSQLKIGNDVKIGMGAVVIRDIPNGATVVGNPAREIEKPGLKEILKQMAIENPE